MQVTGRVKPLNRWSDNICDCAKNCYPSCFCTCCCCYGIYLVAQSKIKFVRKFITYNIKYKMTYYFPFTFIVSEKTGFVSFSTILGAYGIVYLISIIVSASTGSVMITWFPMIFAFLCHLALRIHIAKKENILDCRSNPLLGECCMGFWCWYCSSAQSTKNH